MFKKIVFLILVSLVVEFAAAHGSKIEAIQDVLERKCGIKVSTEGSLVYIKVLYLTCVPKTDVQINATCTVSCMKGSPGMIIGR